jgi:hypothetical protein
MHNNEKVRQARLFCSEAVLFSLVAEAILFPQTTASC